jgi:Putative zinc-finger
MRMDCSQAGAMLDELALDVLPGDRRATLLGHLEECPGCRHLLDELSETADALLLAGPVVAPPAGFENRVLERIDAPRARTGARGRAQARLRLLAVAAAAAVLLGIGGVAGAHLGRSSGGSGHGREFQTVKLISAAGADIGDVSTYAGTPTWFFMRLEGPLPNGTYRCVLDVDDGRTVPIGSLWAANGHGAWGEHVSVDPRHVKAARLLDAKGVTVATAPLH